MSRFMALLQGIALGAGLMYFYDPERGRTRRALVRDQVTHTLNEVSGNLESQANDFRNRAGGVLAEARTAFTSARVSDTTLVERIRAKMGHVVSHPHRIQVVSRFGRVTVSGNLPAGELEPLYRCIAAVRGVVSVKMNLTAEDEPVDGSASNLERYAEAVPLWSPTARLAVGILGGVMAIYGKRRGGLIGSAVGTVGAGLLTGSIRNTQMRLIPRPLPYSASAVEGQMEEESQIDDENDMGLLGTSEHRRRPLSAH